MRNEINNHMHSATETALRNHILQYNTQYIDGFCVNNIHALKQKCNNFTRKCDDSYY